MLTGARLGDDAALAHALGQQNLAEGVVDLVRAGMQQVFALEINLRPGKLTRHALGEIQRCRAAGVFAEVILKFLPEFLIVSCPLVFARQFLQRSHQRLRHEHTAVGPEVAAAVRHFERAQ